MPHEYIPRGFYIPGPGGATRRAKFVMSPEDMPPEGATPAVLGTCDGCPAPAVVEFRGVVLLVPEGWSVALPWVRQLQLCGHHARVAEPALRGWAVADDPDVSWSDVGPWAVALDSRGGKLYP